MGLFQSENVRWAHSLAQYHEQEETLSGDVLLTAAFISYAGSFSKKYRRELLENLWMPFLCTQLVVDLVTFKYLTRNIKYKIFSYFVDVKHMFVFHCFRSSLISSATFPYY